MKKRHPRETHASSQAAAKPQVFERLGRRARDSQGKLFKLQSSNNSGTEKGRKELFSLYPASTGQSAEALRVRVPEALESTGRREPCLTQG